MTLDMTPRETLALDAIERSGFDVLAGPPTASKAAKLGAALRCLR